VIGRIAYRADGDLSERPRRRVQCVRWLSRTWCPILTCSSDTRTRQLDTTFASELFVSSPRTCHVLERRCRPLWPRTCIAYLSGVDDRCDSRRNVQKRRDCTVTLIASPFVRTLNIWASGRAWVVPYWPWFRHWWSVRSTTAIQFLPVCLMPTKDGCSLYWMLLHGWCTRPGSQNTSLRYSVNSIEGSGEVKFHLCVLAFRCLHGTAPRYLAETLYLTTSHSSCSRLRSAATSTLIDPATRRRTLGDRAFPVAAARTWNSLPSFVRDKQSPVGFRQQLKTVLFRTSFSEDAYAWAASQLTRDSFVFVRWPCNVLTS